jgi:hypothetical protein
MQFTSLNYKECKWFLHIWKKIKSFEMLSLLNPQALDVLNISINLFLHSNDELLVEGLPSAILIFLTTTLVLISAKSSASLCRVQSE